uniref:Serine protease easter n=1 Tax=Cacopsylla melanoneura TaxID=428564 RepID=A0A8D8QL40_9HEMI
MNIFLCFGLILAAFASCHGVPQPAKIEEHRNWKLLPAKDRCGVSATQQRIIGGHQAQLGEFPWIARIGYGQRLLGRSGERKNIQYQCGGTLINKHYVLTATHCALDPDSIVEVRLGENMAYIDPDCMLSSSQGMICAPKVQDIPVIKVISHENYSHNRHMTNDIALLRLERPPILSRYVQPVCMPFGDGLIRSFENENTIVAGWGLTEKKVPSNKLLGVQQKVANGRECVQIYERHEISINTSQGQLCVGGKKGRDSCNGDSGGPLMWTGSFDRSISARVYLLGLVSLGPADCGVDIPGIYTRVSYYLNWILDNIEP